MIAGADLGGGSSVTRTRELLEGWLAGRAHAERTLFERHRERLVRAARSRRQSRSVARYSTPEDLADEVFLRVISSGVLRAFEHRGPGSLDRFLECVLDSVVTDTLRRNGRAKRGAGRAPIPLADALGQPEPWLATDTSPTQRVRAAELVALCRAALLEREWEIFRACELEGSSSIEVAARLELSPAAVRGVLRRARETLRAEFVRRRAHDPPGTASDGP